MMHYFLGMKVCRWNLPWTREVCSGDPEEVQDDGMQGNDHTYGVYVFVTLECIHLYILYYTPMFQLGESLI